MFQEFHRDPPVASPGNGRRSGDTLSIPVGYARHVLVRPVRR
jgi:hypothetical protein